MKNVVVALITNTSLLKLHKTVLLFDRFKIKTKNLIFI